MRVTEKGQVTIPIELRERHGIKAGAEVDFADGAQDGELIVRVRKPDSGERRKAFRAWLERIEGTGDSGLSADEILDMTRGQDRQK